MVHGGDIYRNKVNLDFSVNVNPLGVPGAVEQALTQAVQHCSAYPDLSAGALKQSIAKMTGVQTDYILCGNGASELFMAIMHALKPKKTMIPMPSFFGYEHAALGAESEIMPVLMSEADGFCLPDNLEQQLTPDIDLIILANPNNPVGNMIERDRLEHLIRDCREKDIIVVVDECFIEFTGKEAIHSLKKVIQEHPNLIVVRAFTKIFAIPGVRLGYLFCQNDRLLGKIGRQLPEWNLSVFAQAAGVAACEVTDYREKTVKVVSAERTYLTAQLEKAGFTVYPSEANYLLFYTEHPLYEALLEKHILIRDCSNYHGLKKGYYRIAVKTHEENIRLIKAMRQHQ